MRDLPERQREAVVLAKIVGLPYAAIAEKLESRSKDELAMKKLVITGVTSILQGDNTMVIQSKLESFLAPANRQGRDKQES